MAGPGGGPKAGAAGAVTVMGAGAWGTALAKVLVDAGGPGTEVTLWARRPELAERINATRSNPDYLPGTSLPPGIHATADAGEALRDATTVLLGVPAQAMRANLERWARCCGTGRPWSAWPRASSWAP